LRERDDALGTEGYPIYSAHTANAAKPPLLALSEYARRWISGHNHRSFLHSAHLINRGYSTMNDMQVIAATKAWLEHAVIGLNLCPFAKAVYVKNQIRYVVSDATTLEDLRAALVLELGILQNSDPVTLDTTLLIHPQVLTDFLDYNDFLGVADATIDDLGLTGEIQLASFHPHYQFAGTEPDAIDNFTNRSPYPMLHLLREASIDSAVAAFPEASDIFENNIATLRGIGHAGWIRLAERIAAATLLMGKTNQKK
jgi:hypothetical protein